MRKVNFETDRFEVYVSSAANLVFALVVEIVLLAGIYIFWARVRDYVFLTVLSFFFLAIASGLIPLINSVLRGNKNPIWSASRAGLEFAARTTTWTAFKPPILCEWSRVKKILLAEKLLVHDFDGRGRTSHALVVIFNE